MQLRHLSVLNGAELQCYYSSLDPGGEDVWLSMPGPGSVMNYWIAKHLDYLLLLVLGCLVLFLLLFSCLAVSNIELWASGLV
mmetsp:Transcript_97216/g.274806  ORF Transcript_97216/g.274806 Transcript_97216/m.274806 type:complete len:82 (+) Transcript_97216:1-246(+)